MSSHLDHPQSSARSAVVDPVCDMSVDPGNTPPALAVEHGGHRYHFCSEHCRATFQAAPGRDTSSQGLREQHGEQPAAADSGHALDTSEAAEWTCPMHAEIRRPGPGSC